jgi:hypothetical protein
MAKRTRYKKSVRQLYSGDELLSNLDTLWHDNLILVDYVRMIIFGMNVN